MYQLNITSKDILLNDRPLKDSLSICKLQYKLDVIKTYTLSNVSFGGVNGLLTIDCYNNDINRIIFSCINFVEVFNVPYIDTKLQFNKVITKLTLQLLTQFNKQKGYFINESFIVTIHNQSNMCSIIVERNNNQCQAYM